MILSCLLACLICLSIPAFALASTAENDTNYIQQVLTDPDFEQKEAVHTRDYRVIQLDDEGSFGLADQGIYIDNNIQKYRRKFSTMKARLSK